MWRCARCNTELEDQFDSCWKCSAPRDAQPGDTEAAAPSTPLGRERPCLRCGGLELIPAARVIDRTRHGEADLKAQVERDPDAFVFTQASSSALRANICRKCGHAELYAENPEALWEAYQDRQSEED